MIDIDLATLVEWLGAEGAVAGLEHSNRTNSELIALAQKFKVIVE